MPAPSPSTSTPPPWAASTENKSDTYFKLRAVDSAIEINSTVNGNSHASADKFLEFVNSTVAFKKIQMKGVATRNSVTFDGATVSPLAANANFFTASSRNGTVIYHTTGNGLTLNAAYAVTLDTEAVIDGDGGLVKTGDKTLTLAADYAYTGVTRVSPGRLSSPAPSSVRLRSIPARRSPSPPFPRAPCRP